VSDPVNEALRLRSGAIVDRDPLVGLFYDLLKMHLLPADVEQLVRDACEKPEQEIIYSNGWLAKYAQDLVARLDAARRASAKAALSHDV
jgi:hypothetical protein